MDAPKLLLAALLLACCAGHTPAARNEETGPAAAPAGYVDVARFAATEPPPAPGSEAEAADVAALLDSRARRTDADCARANATFFVRFDSLWGERSPFPRPLPAELQAFFDRIDSEIGTIAQMMKERFKRPRPDLLPPCPAPPGGKGRGGGYSYPSTHAAISRAFADVLGDLVPARKAEFIERADAIAADRVLIGVHYPTDVAAGKALADRYHGALLGSQAYRTDLEDMRALLVD
jgi:acid phosphatase (class A)